MLESLNALEREGLQALEALSASGELPVWYRGYLVWLCLPPMLLLLFDRPVAVIVVYSVLGALFMPVLAATLLYMNSRAAWVGERLRNGWPSTVLLLLCLALFGILAGLELWDTLS